MILLETVNIVKSFGGLTAINRVNFQLEAGRIISIIGPNGAGKTTFFNTLTGLYKPDQGKITFNGKSIVGLRPDQIAAKGMARTFQNIRLFSTSSALQNVMVGFHLRQKNHWWMAPLMLHLKEEKLIRAKAMELLDRFGLTQVAHLPAGSLPYGAQRRLEIARALAAEPLLLLLDEPAAGMNPQETEEVTQLFRNIRDEKGITILLIEHDMRVVMNISEQIMVMDYGEKIAEGSPAQIRTNTRVIEAYLGRGAVAGQHEEALG